MQETPGRSPGPPRRGCRGGRKPSAWQAVFSPFRDSTAPLTAVRSPSGRVSARDANPGHDAFEEIVWLGAHHQVAIGNDVRRDTVDHQLLRLLASRVQVIAVAIGADRRFHSWYIDAGSPGDVAQHVRV